MLTKYFVVLLAVCIPPSIATLTTAVTSGRHATTLSSPTSPRNQPGASETVSAKAAAAAKRASHGAAAMEVPLLVDGAVTPANIPADMAYRHFVAVVALGPAAPTVNRARRDAILAQVGLSPEDTQRFEAATRDLPAALNTIDERRRQVTGNSEDARQMRLDLKKQRESALNAAAASARAVLSPDGGTRFERFVTDHVKPHIKIFGM